MPRQKGFRLVEVVNLLTEVTTMLATAIRKAGGPPIDQNQFFSDLQDLVKRYGTSAPEPVLANAEEPPQDDELGEKPDYNLAADLLSGAVLSQQVGNTQEAWSGFKAACAAVGIDQVLEAFEAYNNQAMSDLGSDPTVTDNVHTENGDLNGEMDTPPSDLPPNADLGEGLDDEEDEDDDGEDRLAVQDDQTTNVQKFMNKRKSRAQPHAETVALANKISQSGSKRSLKMVRANFI